MCVDDFSWHTDKLEHSEGKAGLAEDWNFVCRKSDSGGWDDRRCSCSAATAEDAKFMMAQNEKDRDRGREGDGLDAKSGTQRNEEV